MLFSPTSLFSLRLSRCSGGAVPRPGCLTNHQSCSALLCHAVTARGPQHRLAVLTYHTQTVSALQMTACQQEKYIEHFYIMTFLWTQCTWLYCTEKHLGEFKIEILLHTLAGQFMLLYICFYHKHLSCVQPVYLLGIFIFLVSFHVVII